MDNQISIFDVLTEESRPAGELILFKPRTVNMVPKKPNNAVEKGGTQEVFSVKDPEKRKAIADWLYEHQDHKYYLAYILGVNLGLRGNELLSLRFSDIVFPNGEFRYAEDGDAKVVSVDLMQRKTHKRRAVWLNQACVNAITKCYPVRYNLYSDKYLFPSRKTKYPHISVDCLRKVLKEAADACGVTVNIGSHSLRKTFGYMQYQAGTDITMLQELFGHSSPLITMRYIGIDSEMKRQMYLDVSFDPTVES